jgi:hypothetical protein
LQDPLKKFLRQGVREGFAATESWRMLAQAMTAQPIAMPRNVVSK